ncbi:MAG: hypothetical protein KAW09_08120 [Thermoplasmata archaeon]|nr:hypothetical protein [Thermoplasmata archaeon]
MGEERTDGRVIDKAYDVLEEVYNEVYTMKSEFEKILRDMDPSLAFKEEYSRGGKGLGLRSHHVFFFMRERDEEDLSKQFVLAMFIIFRNSHEISRTSLDEPELWVLTLETTNFDREVNFWDIRDLFKVEERKNFEKPLEVGGNVFSYLYEEENERWEGKFVGYPLTEVENAEFIRDKILGKLLPTQESS